MEIRAKEYFCFIRKKNKPTNASSERTTAVELEVQKGCGNRWLLSVARGAPGNRTMIVPRKVRLDGLKQVEILYGSQFVIQAHCFVDTSVSVFSEVYFFRYRYLSSATSWLPRSGNWRHAVSQDSLADMRKAAWCEPRARERKSKTLSENE